MAKLRRGQVGSKNINKAIAEAVAEAIASVEIEPGDAVPDSEEVGSPTTAEFNALLTSLRGAGLIAAE